jgi:predicted secreted hydrolase
MSSPILQAVDDADLAREGLSRTPQPWEDGLRTDTGPGSFEWWYFDAHLADGSTAVIVFMTKPLLQRRDPLSPAVMITITRPDGVRLSQVASFDAGQFQAAKEDCAVRIGDNEVTGDLHTYRLHARAGDLAADLVFTGSVPPWRPGAGKTYYSADRARFFGWLPAVPYGSVEGSLSYDGAEHAVQGACYHDHNWGTVDLNQVMSHWYWGRAHIAGFTLIFVEMVSTPGLGSVKMPVFLIAQGERILTGNGRPLTLQTGDFRAHPGGRSYPEQLSFNWQQGDEFVRLRLCHPQIIESTSLLSMLTPWKRRLARLVANPYYFRFNSELDLEVHLGGVEASVSGAALYELMLLR